jgi:hypothetical protein
MSGILGSGRIRRLAPGLMALALVAACGSTSPTELPGPSSSPTSPPTAALPGGPTSLPSAQATPTPLPTPTPSPTIGPCAAVNIAIDITADSGNYWQGAAGQRQAKFTLTNGGSTDCIVKAKSQPLLLNGDGAVLITGAAAGSSASVTVPAGASLSTEVKTGNLCNAPTIVAPIRVAFVMPGTGTEIATTASATDTGGIPSCLGDANVTSGDISMTTWAP